MLRSLRIPITWGELAKKTAAEVVADDCFGLAAQLSFYFFLALFPALLFVVALVSYLPIEGVMDSITAALGRVAPLEVMTLIKDQLAKIANDQAGGLLTLGMLGTLWSTSAGLSAIIDTLNAAYDIEEARPWWKVKLLALGLTVALAAFIVVAFALVVVGPQLADKVAQWAHLGAAFAWTWKIAQWPIVFALVSLGIAIVYYWAPDAEQEWVWITPGAVLATILWVVISVGFRFYVVNFGSYNATYGAIGGVIVTMLWFYVSSLVVLVGAEMNAEIEHASPHGKAPGEKVPGERTKLGVVAARAWRLSIANGTWKPAVAPEAAAAMATVTECPLPARPSREPRASDWILATAALLPILGAQLFKKRMRS